MPKGRTAISRRSFVGSSLALIAGTQMVGARQAEPGAILSESKVAGPFQPNWESLKSYQCPEWFRDAKFGIWAHWGPQCVPEQGDWYARSMYLEGSPDYEYHVKTYGPPSKFGYKDIMQSLESRALGPGRAHCALQEGGRPVFCRAGQPPRWV